MAAFAHREEGERSKLIAHLKTLKETDTEGKPIKDQGQIQGAVALAVAEIEALPKDFNSALVILEGHNNGVSRAVTVQVIGKKTHV